MKRTSDTDGSSSTGTPPGDSRIPPARRKHAAFLASLIGALLPLIALAAIVHWRLVPVPQLRTIFRPLYAGLFSLLALWCVVYAAWRGPLRWNLALPLLALTYLGIERFAPPFVHVPLELKTYNALQDPDHRPHRTGRNRGWNSDSLRCQSQPEEFRAEDTNIIFLGDSFTFGMNLDPDQCFPQLVEDQLEARDTKQRVRVANFAWTSSSPLLSWRRLVDIGEKYHPDLVALCVDMTDIRDDIRWKALLEQDGVYGLVAHIPITMRALEFTSPSAYAALLRRLNPEMPIEPFFMSEAPLEETRPFFAEITKNINRIEAWCDDHGAKFVVIVLPRTYQCNEFESPKNWEADRYTTLGPYSLEPFRFFDELQPDVNYPIHSLLETFQTTEVFPTSFEDDPHWNPEGAQVAADAVYDIVVDELSALGLL